MRTDPAEMRAAVEAHWAASGSGDPRRECVIYHDGAVVDYPQSGERVAGCGELLAARSPTGDVAFSGRRILCCGDLAVSALDVVHDGSRVEMVGIMEFADGRVIHETQYLADPLEPPPWQFRGTHRER
jgi:hypothetical protein